MKKLVGLNNELVRSNGEPFVDITNKSLLVKDVISELIDNYPFPPKATVRDMKAFKKIMDIGISIKKISDNELIIEDSDYEILKMVIYATQHIKVACVIVQVVLNVVNVAVDVAVDAVDVVDVVVKPKKSNN